VGDPFGRKAPAGRARGHAGLAPTARLIIRIEEPRRRPAAPMTRPDSPSLSSASSDTSTAPDTRLALLREWLAGLADRHGLQVGSIRPASNDASFRRYFRIDTGVESKAGSVIAMDAPPPQEDC